VYLLVLLSLILAACTGGTATTAPEGASAPQPETTTAPESESATEPEAAPPSEPSVLRIGWLGKPDTLNPAYAFLTESYVIFDLVYGTLTTESIEGQYIGNLASEWSHSEDGLVWTFNLRDGVKWHDGSEFTADQMAWAIHELMNDHDV